MANCPFCGTRAAAKSRRCQECGADLSDNLEPQDSFSNDETLKETSSAEMETPPVLEQQVVALLRRSQLISAIKLYREQTGQNLRESKLAVEAIGRKHGIVPKNISCGTSVLLFAIGTIGGLWWVIV